MKNFSLCAPAFIYIFISFIILLVTSFKSFNIINTVISLFFILLWTWVLNYLCSKGYKIVAWLILISMIIFLSFGLITAIQLFKK
jgi:hypothetical protein